LCNTLEKVWDHRNIVIGLDIDSIASALFLQSLYPEARIVALYDTEHIIVLQENVCFATDVLGALWLDQDILHGVLSVGQHLITGDCDLALFGRNAHSFNPNEYFQQKYAHSFRRNDLMANVDADTDCTNSVMRAKYPYSTLMLLLHTYDRRWSRNAFMDAVLRHADSVGSNIRYYARNCEAWRRLLFAAPTRQQSTTGASQIDSFLRETQQIYNAHTGHHCLCEHCNSEKPENHKRRRALQNHLRLMLDLHELMPNSFDSLSRKSIDIAGNGVCQQNQARVVIDKLAEPPLKRAKVGCTNELANSWLNLFRGYQGLKLSAYQQENKMDCLFDKEEFLCDLNAFCRTVGTRALNMPQSSVPTFAHFRAHTINRSEKRHIKYDRSSRRTVVCDKSGLLIPLNDFLKSRNVFSYAIIEEHKIRYTAVGGCLTDPTIE